MLKWLAVNSDAIQAIAAIVSVAAIVSAAVVFVPNQRAQLRSRREEKYLAIIDEYKSFLELALSYPHLGVTEHSRPVSPDKLTTDQLTQRDILFEILTSILERAFIAYEERSSSFREHQWRGWESYIAQYAERVDYLDWWVRVYGNGDWAGALSEGASEYDRRFEDYMIQIVAKNRHKLPRSSLDRSCFQSESSK